MLMVVVRIRRILEVGLFKSRCDVFPWLGGQKEHLFVMMLKMKTFPTP